ncbi:MAG: hypothetical protein RL653_2887 [Pseudomonadota bacterium]|jgi:hypothetical protein
MRRVATHTWALGGLGVLSLVAWATVASEPPLQDAAAAAPAADLGALPPAEDPAAAYRAARDELVALVPEYPGAVSVPMGRLEANGNAVNLMAFHTADSPGQVASWYAARFRAAGHAVRTQPDPQGTGLSVTYYDSQKGWMVGVAATPLPAKKGQRNTTLGLPSVTRVAEGVLLRAEAPRDFPAVRDAVTVLRLDDATGGPTHGSQTLVNLAPGAPRAVAEGYLASLSATGYETVSQQAREGTELLEFKRGAEKVRMTVSAVARAEGATAESLVTVIRERAEGGRQ